MHISSISKLAPLIDEAIDSNDLVAIRKFIVELNAAIETASAELELAKINFFLANCHSACRKLIEGENLWSWDSSELENEIYCLRVARNHISRISLEEDLSDLRFRIYTNLANALNHVGRPTEALSFWNDVLDNAPDYAMAIANKGYCLYWYSYYLYDTEHQHVFLGESYRHIKRALKLGVESHATGPMERWLEHLLSFCDWESYKFHPDNPTRSGRSKAETEYRTWCLQHKLFLNPLNDVFCESVAANDTLTFPPVIITKEDANRWHPPEVFGIYNQLKQEFVSARYMLFDALGDAERSTHFSDRKVLLYDILDYRMYGLWIEKVKMAFLGAHAIFDKIAYLVNEYWALEIPSHRINFKSCWHKGENISKELKPMFRASENWPLRGLYWLSKDFVGEGNKTTPLQPDAWHIAQIRNHIAHKYLKVFDSFFVSAEQQRKRAGHEWEYPISDKELITQTLNLLCLVRNALIYVSLAAHSEERKKRLNLGDDGLIAEMPLWGIDDTHR